MTLPPPPRTSAGPAPVRVPGSVRRTSSIDVFWPEGLGRNLRFVGRARDVLTPPQGGRPVTLAEDGFEATLRPDRTIVSIEADPPRPALSRLIGAAGGGGLRRALAEAVPEEKQRATPLYLILDDLAGTSLVSAWAWSQWDSNWMDRTRAALRGIDLEKAFKERIGVCIAYAPGSDTVKTMLSRGPDMQKVSVGGDAPDLRNSDDPEGWHVFAEGGEINMRRARRIDVWMDGVIVIDSAFQDSATTPEGGRRAVHEYSLRVTADPATLRMLTIDATPRVLPHNDCPSAVQNMIRLLDAPLPELREKVLAELRGAAGCTHLNDALRALADVPVLLERLPAPARKVA